MEENAVTKEQQIKSLIRGSKRFISLHLSKEDESKKRSMRPDFANNSKIYFKIDPQYLEQFTEDNFAPQFESAMEQYRRGGNKQLLVRLLHKNPNITFVECLQNYIVAKNATDPEVYKAAYVDRRLFSKMMSDKDYQPSKDTAVSLAFALKLSSDEAVILLNKAGYTLSNAKRRDVILKYFFKKKVYDINDINEVLYSLDEKPLGK